MCWPKNLLKTWAKFKPVTRHHSWQRGMSDFDMYILPLLQYVCNQNENYYCWSSMIMSSYFNVQYLHQKIIRIYADIVQNHTLPGVFPNFWRAVCIYIYSISQKWVHPSHFSNNFSISSQGTILHKLNLDIILEKSMCSLYRSTNLLSSKNNSTYSHYCPNNWQQKLVHPKWTCQNCVQTVSIFCRGTIVI